MDTIAHATKLGHDAGIAAASWVFGDRTTPRTYAWYAQGIADGDPEVMDSLREPSLSGEFSDDYSERDLAYDLGFSDGDDIDDEAEAWNAAASESFWAEVERIARQNNPDEPVERRRDGIAYLMAHGDSRVPCSRYGRWSSDCAPVAWRVAYLVARESGEGITHERLDHAMGLVVNDHDDVSYLVNTYGHGNYGR
jgi:hypothetical protein